MFESNAKEAVAGVEEGFVAGLAHDQSIVEPERASRAAYALAFAEPVYGIRPDQVVGTAFNTPFVATKDGNGLVIEPELRLNNNYGGKTEDFYIMTGRHPKATFGNSDGDEQMLEFSQGGNGPSLQMLVLHDDAAREYAYGPATGLPDSKVGTFSQALYDRAGQRGWYMTAAIARRRLLSNG